MRCDNCFWFPMEEKSAMVLICPNCGYEHIEGPNENFIRKIYQEHLMNEDDCLPYSIENLQEDIIEKPKPTEEQLEFLRKCKKLLDERARKDLNENRTN